MSKPNTPQERKNEFAARFNKALDIYGVPLKNYGRSLTVAEMFSLTQRGAARWVNGEVLPPKERRRRIADKLGVSYEWLEFGRGEPTLQYNDNNTVRSIPLIEMKDARDYQRILSNFSGRRVTMETLGSVMTFMVRLTGKAMEPRVAEGSVLVVDPLAQPLDGSYVLAVVGSNPDAIFRKYSFSEGKAYLTAANPTTATVPFTATDRILGVVIEIKIMTSDLP